MRGCFFSPDSRYLYTLSTESRQKSYLVKWENKQRFSQKAVQSDPVEVAMVHPNTVTGMCTTPDASLIGIRTSDGFVKVIHTSSFSDRKAFVVNQRRHRMPVTCLGFQMDFEGHVTHVVSGSSDYSYNIIPCRRSMIGYLVGQAVWVTILAVIIFLIVT